MAKTIMCQQKAFFLLITLKTTTTISDLKHAPLTLFYLYINITTLNKILDG